MFETVAPEAFQTRSRRVFIETLPISIALHVIAIVATMASMIWNVSLPTQSPKFTVAYSLTQVPDPPPPPPAPKPAVAAKQAPVQPKPAPAPTAPTVIVAPTVIPDTIPDVVPPQPAPPPPPVAAPVAVAPVAAREPGMASGKPGGSGRALGTIGGITFGDDGRVYVERTSKLPLKEIEHAYPHYPDAARKNKLEGTCVVRYTIGKNGHVIDIAILDHAKDPMFDAETLDTIKSWIYRPMMVDGKPVEVVHEVEVNYQFIVR
jgi:protein TonB